MKTSDLEVAKKLAMITNKPLEDFYECNKENIDGVVENERENDSIKTSSENEVLSNTIEIKASEIEDETDGIDESDCNEQNVSDSKETKDNEERSRRNLVLNDLQSLEELAKYYNGKISERGFILDNKIQMTKKEYNTITKNLSYPELFKHPLLYVLFRAEGQVTPSFIEWTSSFEE